MDKLRIMEYIAVVNNIIIGLAASITTFVAVRGLNSWQREHTWKDNSEVARALMRATYKLRNQLHYARSPCVFPSELPKDYSPNSRDKTAQSEAEALSHVFTHRWKYIADALQEFEVQVLEAKALWGSAIKTKADDLKSCVATLSAAMQAMVANTAGGGEDFKSDKDFAKSIKRNVWSVEENKDELSVKISNAVSVIEDEVGLYLKRK